MLTWHKEKVVSLQLLLKEQGITASFIFNHVEIFYFTGYNLGNLLYIPQNGKPILFVRRAFERIEKICPFKVVLFKSFKDILPYIVTLSPGQKVALPLDNTPYSLIAKLIEALEFDFNDIVNLTPIMNNLARVKSPYEINAISNAGTLINDALLALKKEKLEGKREIDISSFLTHFMRTRGYIGEDRFKAPNHPSLGPVVLTKQNILTSGTTDTPYAGNGITGAFSSGASLQTIEKNYPFVVDIVCNTQGFYCDITRTFVIGEIPPLLAKRYKDLIELYENILESMKIGVLCSTVYEKAVQIAQKMGYANNFMGLNNNKVSFIGHSIGIFIDEYPAIAPKMDIPISENNVFAIEPKFFFEDFYCVGIENTVHITENKIIPLTPLSNEIIVVTG